MAGRMLDASVVGEGPDAMESRLGEKTAKRKKKTTRSSFQTKGKRNPSMGGSPEFQSKREINNKASSQKKNIKKSGAEDEIPKTSTRRVKKKNPCEEEREAKYSFSREEKRLHYETKGGTKAVRQKRENYQQEAPLLRNCRTIQGGSASAIREVSGDLTSPGPKRMTGQSIVFNKKTKNCVDQKFRKAERGKGRAKKPQEKNHPTTA